MTSEKNRELDEAAELGRGEVPAAEEELEGPDRRSRHGTAPLGRGRRAALASRRGGGLLGCLRGRLARRHRLQRAPHRPALGQHPGRLRERGELCRGRWQRRRGDPRVSRHLDRGVALLHRAGARHGELRGAPEPGPARANCREVRAPAALLLRRPPARRHDQPRHQRPRQGLRGAAAGAPAAADRRGDGPAAPS